MKDYFLLLVLVLIIKLTNSDDCENWPEDLRPLRSCCELPRHANPTLLNFCYKSKCNNKNFTDDERNECGARCFANMTLLLDENGQINKSIVKRTYNMNADYSEKWVKVINSTIDSSWCVFDCEKPLAEGIASYFECVDSHLEKNCVSFVENKECDKVQEHFESCNNITANCSKWPENMMSLEMCCKVPRLFSRRFYDDCRKKCYQKEMFPERQMKCIRDCLMVESNIKVDGKFDFEAVKHSLINNSRNNSQWTNVIENSIKNCNKESDVKTLWECLTREMSENCVEFRKSSRCNKVRRLKLQCPDLKSRHHENDDDSNATDNKTNEHDIETSTTENHHEHHHHDNTTYETLFDMISFDNFDE